MILADIIEFFRIENPEITTNRISDALLKKWCLPADKEVCAITRSATSMAVAFCGSRHLIS